LFLLGYPLYAGVWKGYSHSVFRSLQKCMERNGMIDRISGVSWLLLAVIATSCGGSGGALKAVGKPCSNDSPQVCTGETFCKLPTGECAMSSIRSGVCATVASVCTEIYSPVCGCDNTTYSNECSADGAAVSILYTGECRR
jgi:hypothetical protein